MSAGCCGAAAAAARAAPRACAPRAQRRGSFASPPPSQLPPPRRCGAALAAATSRSRGSVRGRLPSAACAAGEENDAAGPVSDAEAVINAVDKVSKVAGKDFASLGRNLVLGADDSIDNWRLLDEKVNTYPFVREFKTIGSGGEDFVLSMMAAAASVTGEQMPRDMVRVRQSSSAKYQAVHLWVRVTSGDEVIAIFQAMQADKRMRFFL